MVLCMMKRRGSGIGLSVVRGLVEAMGGRIAARSVDPHGLAVEMWLPIVDPAGVQGAVPPEAHPGGGVRDAA